MGTDEIDHARTLLNGVPALQRLCDLDLLVFFARHSRTLLSTEQLAQLLGYPLTEIARSRDAMLAAGFLARTQDRTRPERMYRLASHEANGSSLPAVVELASTRAGRLALRRALKPDSSEGTDGLVAHVEDHAMASSGARLSLDRCKPETETTRLRQWDEPARRTR